MDHLVQENSGCSQSDQSGRTVCQDSSLHQTLDLFSMGTMMQLNNGEVSVNKDSCSQFFSKAEVKGSALFFFFPPTYSSLSTPSWNVLCLYLSCNVYLFLFCAMPLTSKFLCPFNFLFFSYPGPIPS